MANEAERLAALEAILTRVESKLDRMSDNYPTRLEVTEMLRSRDEKIKTLEEERKSKVSMAPMWVSVLISLAGFLYAIWPKK